MTVASSGPAGDAWHPVVINESTGWVRDYRGLWGHDTRDRLGGERGPAGPRYERDGTVRQSWADPVGWAGLAKVAPNADVEAALIGARLAELGIGCPSWSPRWRRLESPWSVRRQDWRLPHPRCAASSPRRSGSWG
ncbi:MAG: hypothetical protein IPJ14_10190 [Kineosporiaceae bacterium]|nr:hypothetical protein [Kineosporiaceae bacterium]